MVRILQILITLTLLQGVASTAAGQCSVPAYWVNDPIAAGTLTAQGVLPGSINVTVRSTGSYAAGRPIYWGTTYVYLARNYSSLFLSRGNSFGTGNRTTFKLSAPVDSNHVHIRVSDVRGDGFNTESQRVQGWLNGTAVAATFTDPVNGATVTGGNVITGASNTTSTVQSSMRAHFNGPVDSISVTATGFSDYVIIELMSACDLLLPDASLKLCGRPDGTNNLLWTEGSAAGWDAIVLERSSDGRRWTDLADPASRDPFTFRDGAPQPGRNLYRLRLSGQGRTAWSNLIALGTPLAQARWASYPNPCRDRLVLDGPDLPLEVGCYSPDGSLLRDWKPRLTGTMLNTAGLPTGLLLLKALYRDGSSSTFRIVHD